MYFVGGQVCKKFTVSDNALNGDECEPCLTSPKVFVFLPLSHSPLISANVGHKFCILYGRRSRDCNVRYISAASEETNMIHFYDLYIFCEPASISSTVSYYLLTTKVYTARAERVSAAETVRLVMISTINAFLRN